MGVPRDLCSLCPKFSRSYGPRSLCSQVSMFPEPCVHKVQVSRFFCSQVLMFPGSHIPRFLIFPGSCVPMVLSSQPPVFLRFLCSQRVIFSGSWVTRVLCRQGPVSPGYPDPSSLRSQNGMLPWSWALRVLCSSVLTHIDLPIVFKSNNPQLAVTSKPRTHGT